MLVLVVKIVAVAVKTVVTTAVSVRSAWAEAGRDSILEGKLDKGKVVAGNSTDAEDRGRNGFDRNEGNAGTSGSPP